MCSSGQRPAIVRISELISLDRDAVHLGADAHVRCIGKRRKERCTPLPYPDASFDRAYSSLVLHFVPNASKAVMEMRRVVRPGGVVAAVVWDNYGGQLFTRILWDIAGVLDPHSNDRIFARSMDRAR